MSAENCGCKQAGQGQVIDELNSAEEAANRLVTKVDVLETQLHTVLRDITPPPSNEEQAKAALVPLADRVRNHHLLLHNLGNRLEEMLERLEIR